jgi:serine phosphatase RsbU (regulator of sigma subunit)
MVLALAFLIIVIFSVSGFFLIQQKRAELSEDLFFNAISFAELTNESLVQSYTDFYVTQSFLQFNRDVRAALGRSLDIDHVSIVGTDGALEYDSVEEKDRQYAGEGRKSVYDVSRLKDIKPSVRFSDGSIAYLLKDDGREWEFVNANEDTMEVDFLKEIRDVAFPHKDLRQVVVYELNYEQFTARIIETIKNILLLIIVAIVFSLFVSIRLSGKLVRPIKKLEEGAEKITKGNLGATVPVETKDEIGRLTQTFNKMSKDLKKNTEELIRKKQLTAEIDLAKEIQDEMLPKGPPTVSGLTISGALVSAEEIGGDVFDFVQPSKTDTYMLVADVTGHGVPASLVAAITNSLVLNNTAFFKKPREILVALNRVLFAKTKANMFATAVLARWESGSKKFSYCSAGHDQIIHYSAHSKKATLAPSGGIALGMTEDADKKLQDQTIHISKNDFLVLYTDGFPEAWKSSKDKLGMERLVKIVEKHAAKCKNPDDLREHVTKEVKSFMGRHPQQDDMTMVVVQRT